MTPQQFYDTLLQRIEQMRAQARDLEAALMGGASAQQITAFSSAYIVPHLSDAVLEGVAPDTHIKPLSLSIGVRLGESFDGEEAHVAGITVAVCGSGTAFNVLLAGEDAATFQALLEQTATLLRGAAMKQANAIMQQVQEG